MAAAIGTNPFSRSDMVQAQQIAEVSGEMLGYLARCERCSLPVAHLVPTVQEIHDRMKAIVTEFNHDATD